MSASLEESPPASNAPVGSAAEGVPLARVRGVGPALAAQLTEQGLRTPHDLARETPVGFDDFRTDTDVTRIRTGDTVVVSGELSDIQRGAVRGRGLAAVLRDRSSGCEVRLLWFHEYRGLTATLNESSLKGTLRVSGRAEVFRGRVSIAHPTLLPARATGIEGRYRAIGEIPARTIGRLARAAAELCRLPDAIPGRLREREQLVDVHAAVMSLHAPPQTLSAAECQALASGDSAAHRRLALEELFVLNVAARASTLAISRPTLPVEAPLRCSGSKFRERMIAALSFALSGSQTAAIRSVNQRLDGGRLRVLLQGDVGSGKTVVVGAAVADVLEAGGHVVLMVPTDILARQHFGVFRTWFDGVADVYLVTASTKSERAKAMRAAREPRPAVFIGTQALLDDKLEFCRLGLVVIDEQHRFGAAVRARLIDRARESGLDPHVIVVSATPIPRTLAQSLYSDLEIVSIAAHTPDQRKNVVTRIVPSKERDRVHTLLRRALESGGSAFVVCAAIGAGEEEASSEQLRSVDDVHRELSGALNGVELALLHGRMTVAERDRSVTAFRKGSARVLVATSMIEVGVDVDTANLIVIENAERFGLAQLHQLRGRVGRRSQPSACVLVSDDQTNSRLEVLLRSVDGFEIAEADFAARGSGDLFGASQSGASSLRFAKFPRDVDLGATAKRLARELVDADPALSFPEQAALRAMIDELRERAIED